MRRSLQLDCCCNPFLTPPFSRAAQVKVEYDDRIKISEICSELDVDGLRGDMVRPLMC